MIRRQTLSETLWPDDPLEVEMASLWARNVTSQALDWMWRAFDAMQREHLIRVDLTKPMEQIERDLTRIHFVQVLRLFGAETQGFASFVPFYEYPEMESRPTPPGRPPAYDFAFVFSDNQRWVWPLEAKMIETTGSLAEYLKDVNGKFVAGIAAPIVGEGAMIGYLLVNDTQTVFANLESRLGQILHFVPEFSQRPHRTSHHLRGDSR